MGKTLDKNILVISDLHLGEDLRPGGANVSYLRHLVKLERELESFLVHYSSHQRDGRPWRLVVNGDMVDFMSVMILPELAAVVEEGDEEDRLYGLGFGERQSQKKMERVIARHPGVFEKLGHFVAAGNDLVIVVGNHDAEFHYLSVQKTLVEWLAGLTLGMGASDEARAEFAQRIEFCPWFYYKENLIYIEHGHQYDEYCSFDYLLHPVTEDRRRGRRNSAGNPAGEDGTPLNRKSGIALSVAHAGMRYFANQVDGYDPHTAEHWGLSDYARWGWAKGLRGLVHVVYIYGLMVWRLVELWYSLRGVDVERRELHHARLKQLSAHWKMSEEKLLALDSLRKEPVTRRFWKLLAALFIDRMLLGIVAVIAATVMVVLLPGAWKALGALGAVLAFAGVNELLNNVRLESSAVKLRATTSLIQGLVCAPFIVFGHSHAPERVPLSSGATYFNTGTWASDDISHAFTHLMVVGDENGAPQAELRQWRDGASAPFANLTKKGKHG
jgi:UDP-2,3-diacylglucosamine pyrophosphatase LpxH